MDARETNYVNRYLLSQYIRDIHSNDSNYTVCAGPESNPGRPGARHYGWSSDN